MKKIIIILIILIIAIATFFIIKTNKSKYEYNTIKITSFEYLTLISNEKHGIINKKGETIISPAYTEIIIPNPEKDIFFCYNGDSVQVLNSKNEKIFTDFESVEPIKLKNVATTLNYEKNRFKFKKDGKYGLIDEEGKVVVKNIYESVENLQLCEGLFLVKQNGRLGIVNLNGTVVIKPSYDSISSDGYYTKENGYKKSGFIVSNKTEEGYRFGYVTNTGDKYLDTNYNSVVRIFPNEKTTNIFIIASQKGQYGVFKDKRNIINTDYQSIEYDENSDLLITEKNKKYGVASLDGKIIIPNENTSIESKGIYLYAKQDLENKVYDYEGNKINISFNKAIYKTENDNYRISTLENNDSVYYGILDKNGNTLVSEKYDFIEYAFGTYFIAKNEDGKYGIISSNGKEVIEFKYKVLQKLKDKNILQAVDAKEETTIFGTNLKILLTAKNANISNEEGYIKISTDEETIYLDSEGNKIDENSDLVKNTNKLQEPEKIGKYKKVQFTLENVYYVEE